MADQWCQEVRQHSAHLARSLGNFLKQASEIRLPGQKQIQTSNQQALSTFMSPSVATNGAKSTSKTASHSAAAAAGVTKEDVGRATWLFLHTLAAQYPEKPTRQQQKDAKTLMDVLTRLYPCGECARHFKDVVKANPPKVGSKKEFSTWMCQVHNVVNRSLGKPTFNCDLVESRWAGLECDEEDACALNLGRAVNKRQQYTF